MQSSLENKSKNRWYAEAEHELIEAELERCKMIYTSKTNTSVGTSILNQQFFVGI